MKKDFFELVKKGFATFKDAATLYFTKDGKAFTKKEEAEAAAKVVTEPAIEAKPAKGDVPAIDAKEAVIVDEGYTVVNRSQLMPLEASFAEAAKTQKEA